ncbi:MAG: Calx-beta domain-containing protein [Bythopirellula sp.]|nr:Calx-beta domain-containing protein [Bythopirellula sp.]
MPRNFASSLFGKGRKNKVSKSYKPFTRRGASGFSFEALEDRRLLAVTSFRDGESGYAGTQDTVLYNLSANVNFGTETSISPDQQDANGVRQGLMRFDNIFGNGPGQIPLGSTITSATLDLSVVNSSFSSMQMSFYRMLTPWTEATATWNTFGSIGGVQASEGEASDLPPDGIQFDPTTGVKSINVTKSLQNWSAGDPNFGWLIESASSDGWDFETSEAGAGDRPKLNVTFTAPTGAGTIQLLDTAPRFAEGDSGTTTATIEVSRLGGLTANGGAGVVQATYSVLAGSAETTDFVEIASGTVSFADGQTTSPINITINGDTALEGNETIIVTLSAPTNGAGLSNNVATVTIADDDALINEVLANVSDDPAVIGTVTDETNREFIELIGTPGASLAGYYFVVFESEEEAAGGTTGVGAGIADLVVDLSAQTFGANGLLVLTPTNWAYTQDAQTNRMIVAALDAAGGGLEDESQTYALVYSPGVGNQIVQGTDYDTIGTFENASNTAIGTGVGILDHPLFVSGTAQMIDSVGVVEAGADRDRTATTPELGHPGIHIHQPTGAANSNNLTSDALSRREGNFLPNSIGSWFNGDIFDTRVDNDPIQYLNGTTRISSVAPAGSVLTPGAPNTLRNVFITADLLSVDEAAGTASFTVTRTGDTSQAIDVAYTTLNGTALAGTDYVAQSGILEFGVGEDEEIITINLVSDSQAEGFETFSVSLTSADSPFIITTSLATITINDADVEVATFQLGTDGYNSSLDTYLDASQPNLFLGFGESLVVDDQVGDGELTGSNTRPAQTLIKFDDVFGAAMNQVPEGAQIFGGFLTVKVLNPSSTSANIELFRMKQDWDVVATWDDPQGSIGNAIENGVTPDNVEATVLVDGRVNTPGQAGLVQIPVSVETLQAWANGSLSTFGWMIASDSDNSWVIASSEDGSLNPFAPELTILYTNPVGVGEFAFSDIQYDVAEGGTATITVQRVGGLSGAANVSYSLTTGSAEAGDVTSPLTGSVSFGPTDLFKTFTVSTFQDTTRENDETFNLALTGTTLGTISSTLAASTLTIRDNDFSIGSPSVVMSEIVYNQPGNDGGSELLEIAGTAGVGLGSLYVVVIGGDVGSDEGATNLVVDLGTYNNGSNGTTLIGSLNNFSWTVPTGTTFIGLPELDAEFVGGNDNGTSTYALVYSPTTPLLVGRFDYDWDNDGSLELPAGAVVVDSIGVKDNSSTDVTYGGLSNTLITNPVESYDGVSRLPGTTGLNNAAQWYGADLLGSNDALVYNPTFSIGLPSPGAAATPGEVNTGTAVQNPRVTLTSVTTTSGVQVNFSGNVTQVLDGDGSANSSVGIGISVTNTSGLPVAGVDLIPTITGFGTPILSLTFSGAQTVGGQLPAGTYNINLVGNSLVGNGRAVDAANTGSTSNTSVQITVAPTTGDFDGDGDVDGRDFLRWQRGQSPAPFSGTDLTLWQNTYGTGPLEAASTADDNETSVATQSLTFTLDRNSWVTLPEALAAAESSSTLSTDEAISEVFAEVALADPFFASDDDETSEDLFSFAADDEGDAYDDAFADWEGLALAI